MAPRKNNVLTVINWLDTKEGKLYKGIVKKAVNKTKYIHVSIENLHPTQMGRVHEMHLPLPIRPSKYHKTCSFLLACGIDATIDGVEICLDDIAGTSIGMKFGKVLSDGSQEVDFERIEDSSNTRAKPRTEGSGVNTTQNQSNQSEADSGAERYDK